MGLKIAVVLVGLCNVKQKYFDYVYTVFDKIKEEGHDVDFFCHFWLFNPSTIPDKSFGFDFSNKYIPKDCNKNQNKLISHIKPKKIIFSGFDEIEQSENFKNLDFSKTSNFSFINRNSQFYGIQKCVNSIDFSEYDFVLRWRYDLLGHHDKESIDKIINTIEKCLEEEKTIMVNNITDHISSPLGINGIEDTIIGIPTKLLSEFSDFFDFVSMLDITKDNPHNELKLSLYLKYKNLSVIFLNYGYTFIRPYARIKREDFFNDINKVIDQNPQKNVPLHLNANEYERKKRNNN